MSQYDHFPGHYLETSFLIYIRVGMLHIVTRRSYPEVSRSFFKSKKQKTNTHINEEIRQSKHTSPNFYSNLHQEIQTSKK